ncbi:MAG: HAMP domain-containing histidine kinase [Acidobacteria bacterium]|nr:HAMP domain-containing histidine kinase [Acidobacteriota bacterium]
MRLPDASAPAPAFPWRRLARIAAAGLACAFVVAIAGRVVERAVLGADDADARGRAEAEVQRAFDQMGRALRLMALGIGDAPSVAAAARGDVTAARRLFEAADAALSQPADAAAFALTVYAADGRPLAWGGRPSELPADRLQGREAWFLAPGALGLRLVYVAPVIGADGVRVGHVATERSLGSSTTTPAAGADAFRYPSRVAPVSLQLSFEGARASQAAPAFEVPAPSGERLLTASVATADLARARNRWRRASASLALVALAISVVLLSGPLLDWRNRRARAAPYALAVALVAASAVGGRLLLRLASPADWSGAALFSSIDYASSLLRPLTTSPFDFLLTAVTTGGMVALLLFAVEAARVHLRHRRRPVAGAGTVIAYLGTQAGAGVVLAVWLLAYLALLRDTVASTTLDLLHVSLHPLDSGTRLALQLGLIVWHATAVGCGVAIVRAALVWWSVPRAGRWLRVATIGSWALPLVVWQLATDTATGRELPLLVASAAVIALATAATRLKARYRHGSQAFRLTMMTFGLVAPAVIFYPSMFQLAWQAKAQLVEARHAPQARDHRQTIQRLLQESLEQIDRFPGLAQLVALPVLPDTEAPTDRAFQVWRVTGLATYPVTSSVELYGSDGVLGSRFAFNLPEDLTTVPRSEETACAWEIYEEVSPFFAVERRVLHAGRAVCAPDGRPVGSIVVHAILDYANLPFIASQNPYVELMRPADLLRGEGVSGRDVEFAFYGWSRTPLYASAVTAWPLDDAVFARIEESRTPLWAELRRGDERYDVYILNDRGGIYALGFPVPSPLQHLVNLAELTVLAWVTYALLLVVTAIGGAFSRRGTTARALMREVRASFYRKLLLAFMAATVVPVVALAVATRNYVADEIRVNVEQEAIRTASAARRVVEDLVTPRAAEQGVGVSDNLMVWVSRLIDQDVNIFSGPRLLATSERNLFASGLLPTRTSADVYRALVLQNEATTVTREQVGELEPYLVAATSMAARPVDAMITVPLTSREREIEAQIDTLDRRVLLGALLFVFGGAAIGYWLAERIADPVNRLTRATRRLARGDLDVRVAATSSDELRRLVQDFNRMAGELQRQQKALERTHRLEAWAEMARQVAHEIKNPLTPIQLNAEHLRRVHADRGQPLHPVLEECVATILTQVKLLRQIASEFSSFASSPTAKPAPVPVPDLVHEAIAPYRAGLEDRIQFDVDVPADLPPVYVDRTLIARSLTNIVENALHVMPGLGALTVVARSEDSSVRIRVSDTGAGMDAEALARAFEPYFSTKTTGTGLGLPIAKRNIELSGGTIAVTSERDKGTSVEVTLPVANPRSGL